MPKSQELRRAGLVEVRPGVFEKSKSVGTDLVSIKTEVAPITLKLNKTEKARLAYLELLNFPYLGVQNITLKIADDCRFTPDFNYIDENGRLAFEDVKGFQREDALIKLKVAARLFRFARFLIVKKDKAGWSIAEQKP